MNSWTTGIGKAIRRLGVADSIAPLINSTAVFVVSALAAGLLWSRIDNAAHLGGSAAGFAVGSVLARRLALDNTRQSAWLFGSAALVVGIIVTAGGFIALYRTAHSGADGL